MRFHFGRKNVIKKFSSTDEYLKYYGFKHVNDYYTKTVYAGYDHGDVDFHYHTFPLYNAIKQYDVDLNLVELLLKDGADPNFTTQKSLGPVLHTILMNSWNENTLPVIKLLLKYGADINIRDDDYQTPLHQVAFRWNNHYSEEII